MPPTQNQTIIRSIECASALAEKVAAAEKKRAAAEAKVAAAIPGVVDAMVEHGVIKAAEGTRLASRLADHATTLEFLKQAVAYITEGDRGSLGSPEPTAAATTKAASAVRPTILGARTSTPAPSDLKFLERVGAARR
jgi:ribosomal protein S20